MATETLLALAPLTPVFFGDGRPNDAGETDFGTGTFPPSPRTVQGVVRTALLRSVKDLDLGPGADRQRIQSLVGPPEHLPDGWQVTGPWPARWTETEDGVATALEPWLPCPGHLLRGRDGSWRFATPRRSSARTDRGDQPLLLTGPGRAATAWLPPADTLRVLRGEPPEQPSPDLPPFVGAEPHTGLRLTPGQRTAEEGMLYTLDFHRFREGSGLLMRFTGTLHPQMRRQALTSGATSFGGKNRVARMLEVQAQSPEAAVFGDAHLPKAPADGARFVVWATTPVLAADPMVPGLHRLGRGRARISVLSAAVGPPFRLGGFSLARGHGAVSRRYLSAGSAWWVEVSGGSPSDRGALLREVHDHCVLGDDDAERTFGFGHALVALPPFTWSQQ